MIEIPESLTLALSSREKASRQIPAADHLRGRLLPDLHGANVRDNVSGGAGKL